MKRARHSAVNQPEKQRARGASRAPEPICLTLVVWSHN